ncbi:MAG: 50S ribosomal protein L22 [Archaeoglobaceae archaeon]|nr:50S ribosomal protein L22 [Archaeoglobaceae archaeon]MDW7989633.1 50S ribosomal protein L22 [Archaeoglobaceae archaeon]
MARVAYSYEVEDETKAVKAMGFEIPMSFKHAVEICREIKGKNIPKAMRFLEEVIDMRFPVPMRRYKKKVAHKNVPRWYAGRYPQKAAKEILKVLKNLKSNAEYKGLNIEELIIVHAQAKRGRSLVRYVPRAFGRAVPKKKQFTTVEFVAEVK